MTAAELIAELSKLPGNAAVVVVDDGCTLADVRSVDWDDGDKVIVLNDLKD